MKAGTAGELSRRQPTCPAHLPRAPTPCPPSTLPMLFLREACTDGTLSSEEQRVGRNSRPLHKCSQKGQTNCQNFLFPAAKTMFETIGQSKPDDPEHFRQLLMSVRRARPKPGFVDFDTLSRIVRSASSPMEARALLMVHMLLPVRMGELWNALFFVDVVKSRKKVNYFHRMGCEGLGEFVFWVYKTRGIGVQKLPVPEELRLVLLSLRMDDEEDGEFVFGSFETRTAFNAHVKDVLGALNPAVRYNVLRHAVVTKLATLCTTFAEFARIAAYMLHLPYSAWYYYCHVDIAARVVGAHAGVTFLGGIGRGLGEGGIGAQLSRELGVLGSGVEWLEELRLSVAVVQEPVEGGAWLGSSVADLALEMEAGPGSALEVGTAPGGMADLALEMEAGPGSALEVGTAPGGMADLALEMEAGLGSATEVGAAPGGLADLALDVEGGPVGVAKVRAGVRGVHGVSRHDGGPKDGNQGAPHTKALKERYRRDCINKRCSELAQVRAARWLGATHLHVQHSTSEAPTPAISQLIYAGEKPKTDKLSILRDTVRVVKQMRVACGGGPVGVAQVGAGGGGPVGVVQGPGEAQLGDGGEGASGDDGEQDGKREAAHKKALREKHRRCRINERFSELAQVRAASQGCPPAGRALVMLAPAANATHVGTLMLAKTLRRPPQPFRS